MSDNLTNKIPFFFMADSIIFLSFGIILILTWPIIEVDLSFFGVFFGIFAISHGFLMLICSYLGRKSPVSKAFLLKGCMGIIVGLLVVSWPARGTDNNEQTLILFFVGWLFAIGAMLLYVLNKFSKHINFKWVYYLAGTSSFAFGTFLLVNLRHHSFSLIWSISFYFLFNGIIMLITSLRDNDSYKPDENSSAAAP